jgi:hypothetical protein
MGQGGGRLQRKHGESKMVFMKPFHRTKTFAASSISFLSHGQRTDLEAYSPPQMLRTRPPKLPTN